MSAKCHSASEMHGYNPFTGKYWYLEQGITRIPRLCRSRLPVPEDFKSSNMLI